MKSPSSDKEIPSPTQTVARQGDVSRSQLSRMENPYATLYFNDDGSAGTASAGRQQFSRSRNPYAWHYYCDSECDDNAVLSSEPPAATRNTRRPTVTKSDFEASCRAIFRAYIPALENGRLRSHHQEFILRNRARSPEVRFSVLEQLRRYDLSNEQNLRTHFNREEDAFTAEKLSQIEQSVSD
jgi:hypothetical protein